METQGAIQSVAPAERRSDLDNFKLRVEPLDRFEGTERGHIAVEIYINGEHLPTYTTDVPELSRSVLDSREFFFSTCSCGSPQCADIWNGIHVRHESGVVAWYVPLEFKGSGEPGRRLQKRVYRFGWDAYRAEIIGCLQCLIDAAHRLPDALLVAHGFEASEARALLDGLLKTDAQQNADDRVPHKRLAEAVEACEEASARCAMADGADLLTLLDDEGESLWERAVFLHGAGGEWQRKFVRVLAHYLATPIPAGSHPEILLKQIVEEGHAELLYRMTAPGGPLPLTDLRAEVCRARLASLRSERQRDEPAIGIADVGQWEEALNRRRELLEIDMKIEALDRSIQMLRGYPVLLSLA